MRLRKATRIRLVLIAGIVLALEAACRTGLIPSLHDDPAVRNVREPAATVSESRSAVRYRPDAARCRTLAVGRARGRIPDRRTAVRLPTRASHCRPAAGHVLLGSGLRLLSAAHRAVRPQLDSQDGHRIPLRVRRNDHQHAERLGSRATGLLENRESPPAGRAGRPPSTSSCPAPVLIFSPAPSSP